MVMFLPILAEAVDKAPPVEMIWCASVAISVVALVLGLVNRFYALIVLPFALMFAMAFLRELHDPVEGSGLVDEFGSYYPVHVYAASVIPFVAITFWIVVAKLRPRI